MNPPRDRIGLHKQDKKNDKKLRLRLFRDAEALPI